MSMVSFFTQRGAHIAQSVEHVLGKNGVTSSNLVVGLNKGGKNGKEEI